MTRKPLADPGVVSDRSMQIPLTAHLPFRRPRPAAAEHSERQPRPSRTRPARRGAICEDRALYACVCGYAFTASVSTTVGCPHCGSTQAW